MKRFTHVAGTRYRIIDGVRRAKAAQMLGHAQIRAEVIDRSGLSLGEAEVPIDALSSPKLEIRRITRPDESRWKRVLQGARQSVLPYPAITIQPATVSGTRLIDVIFDFGSPP